MRHLTQQELTAGLDGILEAPKDKGTIRTDDIVEKKY